MSAATTAVQAGAVPLPPARPSAPHPQDTFRYAQRLGAAARLLAEREAAK